VSIKYDPHYKYYITWLEDRLNKNSINKGQFELLNLSESFFLEFCFRFNNQPKFNLFVDQLYKSENRDNLIKGIIE
jgi:hypothetical protein